MRIIEVSQPPNVINLTAHYAVLSVRQRYSQRFLVLEGKTSPGTRLVLSNGRTLVTDEDGKFSESVELAEGLNKLKVEAIDTIGNKKAAETEVTVDTIAPDGQLGKPIFGE